MPVKYDPKVELHRLPVSTVRDRLLGYGVDLVVISGGEPLNQQKRLVPLVEALTGHGIEIEIETNGTRVPDPKLVGAGVRFNVSPKLSHAGDPAAKRIVPAALTSLAALETSIFKFVCRDSADLDEVAAVVEANGITSVWVMPEGQNNEDIERHQRQLADEVVDRGWNITTRLHTLIWGHKRGV
jgi:organic radical activating enzyme